MGEPTPFQISIPDPLLEFITTRVKTARLPPGPSLPPSQEWSHGVPPSTMQHLQSHWVNHYSWRATEASLNARLRMFTLPIPVEDSGGEVLKIHFVHHRSAREGAVPLLFQHGWPGNFTEVSGIIDLLTDPPAGEQAYHVVAPSLPGFVFSEGSEGGDLSVRQIAGIMHALMTRLGYETYMVQGGDWGSMVVRIMGMEFPGNCVAVHVNAMASGVPAWWRWPLQWVFFWLWAVFQGGDSGLGRMLWWREEECGYLDIQGTKPQTLSYALVDSPTGMLAWLRDKMHPLVDEGSFRWEEDEVITWAMLYLIPGTAGHAEIYRNFKGKKFEQFKKDLFDRRLPKEVDFGASLFPKDIMNIPRWWAGVTVSSNIVFWREHERGGHFPATEKPNELVQDIRDFTKILNPSRFAALKESGKLKR